MKKLKVVSAIVIVLVLTFVFTACSNDNTTANGSNSSQENVSSKISNENDTKSSNKGSGDLLPAFDKSGTIEETHLTDTYDVSITATKLSYTSSAVVLSVKLENKSDSEREAFTGTAGYGCNSINGYMIHDGYMWCELAPGATEEEEISFSYAELNCYGISKIADIGIGFDVEDSKYHHEYSDMITIKTQLAGSYDYTEDTYTKTIKGGSLQNAYGFTINAISENTSYSDGGVSLISQAIITNKDGDSKLMLEFDNKSNQALYVRLGDLKLNDILVEESFVGSDLIWSDKRDVMYISLDDYFEENEALNVNNLKSAEFAVSLSNLDGNSLTQDSVVKISF